MLQVKVIGGKQREKDLEEVINSWIQDNSEHIEVHDIKFGYAAWSTTGFYSAMIIYSSK